jgi:hypothetical protein
MIPSGSGRANLSGARFKVTIQCLPAQPDPSLPPPCRLGTTHFDNNRRILGSRIWFPGGQGLLDGSGPDQRRFDSVDRHVASANLGARNAARQTRIFHESRLVAAPGPRRLLIMRGTQNLLHDGCRSHDDCIRGRIDVLLCLSFPPRPGGCALTSGIVGELGGANNTRPIPFSPGVDEVRFLTRFVQPHSLLTRTLVTIPCHRPSSTCTRVRVPRAPTSPENKCSSVNNAFRTPASSANRSYTI